MGGRKGVVVLMGSRGEGLKAWEVRLGGLVLRTTELPWQLRVLAWLLGLTVDRCLVWGKMPTIEVRYVGETETQEAEEEGEKGRTQWKQ